MSEPPLGELERELTRLFRRARSTSATLVGQIHPDLDVNGYAVLQWLLQTGPAGERASQLVEDLRLHKSNASRTIAELEQLGLVERVPDPADGRARLIRLSDPGRAAVTAARDRRREVIATRLQTWSGPELHQLAVLLGRLNDDLE